MKNILSSAINLAGFACVFCVGVLTAKIYFEPVMPVGAIVSHPQIFMNKTVYVRGTVQPAIALGGLIRTFRMCDENGVAIYIKTNRTVLPEMNTVITLRGRISQPLSTPLGDILVLTESRNWWDISP